MLDQNRGFIATVNRCATQKGKSFQQTAGHFENERVLSLGAQGANWLQRCGSASGQNRGDESGKAKD